MHTKSLDPADLYKPCDPKSLRFKTTASLSSLNGILGQNRAKDALSFAIAMAESGYNIFAVGSSGLGKRTMIERYLAEHSPGSGKLSDWCYVNSFEDPRVPRVLRLPVGMGQKLKSDVEQLLNRLYKNIPQAFENESYFERSEKLKNELAQRQEKALSTIGRSARRQGVSLTIATPGGYRLVAADGDEPMSAEVFSALSDEEQLAIEAKIVKLEKRLRKTLRQLASREQDYAERQQQLNEEVALNVSQHLIDSVKQTYREHKEVVDHLDAIQQDILKNIDLFLDDSEEANALAAATMDNKLPRRYQINAFVHHDKNESVPILVEDNPNYHNLFGAVENITFKGTVFTDFTLIRPGSVHRANGGYLLIDAVKLLEQPFVWEALKRLMRSGKIGIHALEKEISISGTISLEPETIPADLKIILFGDRDTYLLLQRYDPDFIELFKVVADFETEIDRTEETQLQYARFIAGLIKEKGLLNCDRAAVMKIIEQSAREAAHQNKLSLHAADVANLLREANYCAQRAEHNIIGLDDVKQALSNARYRAGRIRDQVFEGIRDGATMLSTRGATVGQVNALSVLTTGDQEFGVTSRLTATTYFGDGSIVDIERDVKLAGAIHSKGMMILKAYLSTLFAQDGPIPLSTSLTFEQSYHEVDGDSASMAEFCALISAMSGMPVRQDLAITGSMNQFGDAQPIGGVNEKIEGFFDTCRLQGLTGTQGVIIPRQNARNLMLADEVLAACRAGKFHIYAVDRVEHVLELLLSDTSVPGYEEVYERVRNRIARMREIEKAHVEPASASPI
ncbi:Lon protease family protein [Allohahella sp. A8]|uniref:Lon protease family protein n=1 Tax=Allohahella sp. A8 TaxID=3141461 RepID=UPI003A7FF2EC